MKVLNFLVVLVTLAGISTVVFWEAERRTSPGPLHPVHAQLKDLAGKAGCARCHGAPGSDAMASACATCHADVGEQIDGGHGLHGALPAVARCGVCHVEHHGAEVEPVGDHAFAHAGVPDRATYDHRHVADFALTGAHAALACAKCHSSADADVLADGDSRFLGLDQTCTTCHDDAHHGTLGADCARCHGQGRPFAQVGEFRHRRFALDGAHAELRCDACHAKGSVHAIAAVEGTDPEPRGCVDCHGPAHELGGKALPVAAVGGDCARCHDTGSFALPFDAAAHAAIGVALDGAHAKAACASCHTASRAGLPRVADAMQRCTDCHGTPHAEGGTALPIAAAARADDCARCHDPRDSFRVPFDVAAHAAVGVTLAGAHASAACARCHTAERAARPRPAIAMRRCADCHAAPHRESFLAAIAADGAPSATCALCHADEEPSFAAPAATMTPSQHAASGFALALPHQDLDCARCHGTSTGREFAARFPGRAADDCASCHGDPHSGQFDHGATGGRCVRCHEATHFVPSAFDLDRHAESGFAIDGAHRAVACARCHDAPAADAPRRFAGAPSDCAACHADVHAGSFDRAGLAATVGGRSGCARCHDTASFAEPRDGFDHGRWTGYALTGAHARTDCAACHGRSATPDARGRTLGEAPRDCARCHEDPHAGQFARPTMTDCARCHVAANSFAELRFDHDRDTRFPLDASHRGLDCARCHRSEPARDGHGVVRYRPLGTACTDCHGGKELRR